VDVAQSIESESDGIRQELVPSSYFYRECVAVGAGFLYWVMCPNPKPQKGLGATYYLKYGRVKKQNKKHGIKYGHLPEKEAESFPWERLCVGDLFGPSYTFKQKDKPNLISLWYVTMIDPAVGWFEIREIPTKASLEVANMVEEAWFYTRYHWPDILNFDRGT
jgi:hypothetical protein